MPILRNKKVTPTTNIVKQTFLVAEDADIYLYVKSSILSLSITDLHAQQTGGKTKCCFYMHIRACE
jgi:hypothetical protein